MTMVRKKEVPVGDGRTGKKSWESLKRGTLKKGFALRGSKVVFVYQEREVMEGNFEGENIIS